MMDIEPCINCKGARGPNDWCYASSGVGRAPMCDKCFDLLVTQPIKKRQEEHPFTPKDNGYGGWNPSTKTAAEYFGQSLYTDHNILDKVPGKDGKY